MADHVVLVTEQNKVLGTLPKFMAHNKNTPLHLGFSVFLFNKNGELLLQKRSYKKKTWPDTWSNSCCGHPGLNQSPIDAAAERLEFELGIQTPDITMILPDYRYRFEKGGIVENEICPIMTAYSEEKPKPNADEIKAIRWIRWERWLDEIKENPSFYSPWCVEETILLNKNPKFLSFLQKLK